MTGRAQHRHTGQSGQGSLEVIAMAPLLVFAILLGWQLVALARGAMLAQEDARARALAAGGSGLVTVHASRRVESVIPGIGTFTLRASATTIGR